MSFPFHSWTWLAILVGLILSGPVLFVLATASGRCSDEAASLAGLGFSWYYAFGLHFCESQVVVPRMDSTRVFVVFLWLYTMILTIAYSTNLTAFLLVQKPGAAMETLKEVSMSGIEFAAYEEGSIDLIQSSHVSYIRALEHVHHSYHFHEEEIVLQRVLEGKAVFLENIGFLNFHIATRFTHRGVSSVRILKECLTHFYVIYGLQRNSPIKRKLDVVIGRLQESAIVKHETRKALQLAATTKEYGSRGKDEATVQEDGVVALGMDHMQGLFIIAVLGWFAGLSVFIIEYFIGRGISN